ncbi:TadE/TadG family type IV pilus assembly protein [Cellulomonas alba]|uniref:TadE/TadG family type IV pilus assembly protein n=1 Tax=Cellulomonas alba TaxID=3053467 RepID=A0ABT7SKC0_9CELL|nr:TadE/TadG family type IV pilus assembly protein [Cellulomonas alba]MDM7856635.1 TadE/TadG family type IV pilus assembly protein [Cellulomonas alba]
MTAARDRGSAVVDFVLVGGLLVLLFVAVLQLALVLHVRNELIDSAAQGARYGALAGHGPQDGAARTRELVSAELSARYAADVSAQRQDAGGVALVDVQIAAPLPIVGLLGPSGRLVVHGHAPVEGP